MFTVGLGEIITDALTTNPLLATVPQASAILDASNYTFQAISFGKDADGFNYHSHKIVSESGGIYNSGLLVVTNMGSVFPSSYNASSEHTAYSSIYSSVPCYPSVYDTRLERNSTFGISSLYENIGQYSNPAIVSSVSSAWNIIGGYAPSSLQTYIFRDSASSMIFSGSFSSYFNKFSLMDAHGYIKISDLNASAAELIASYSAGPKLFNSTSVSSGQVNINVSLQKGDCLSLAAFGGINHIGVWCLDIKQMLADGLTAPFAWNTVNNLRKYKLVAKVTSMTNLLYHEDAVTVDAQTNYDGAGLGYAGFKTILEDFNVSDNTLGILYKLKMRFV